jgi:hypothetical protein
MNLYPQPESQPFPPSVSLPPWDQLYDWATIFNKQRNFLLKLHITELLKGCGDYCQAQHDDLYDDK